MRPDELERRTPGTRGRPRSAPRAELLHVPMLPDFERADRIGEFWGEPGDADLRRAPVRLRGGPDAAGGMLREARAGS